LLLKYFNNTWVCELLETKIKLIIDKPDRIVINESLNPWRWGGLDFNIAQLALVLIYPFILLGRSSTKIVLDCAFGSVTIESRLLFSHRKRQVPFSDIVNVSLSRRGVTHLAGPGSTDNPGISTPFPLSLGDLSLNLSDKLSLRLVTAYWTDKSLRDIGGKISEIIEKPFVEDTINESKLPSYNESKLPSYNESKLPSYNESKLPS
jgi:hypothetical protein